jgi:hypothetical protein
MYLVMAVAALVGCSSRNDSNSANDQVREGAQPPGYPRTFLHRTRNGCEEVTEHWVKTFDASGYTWIRRVDRYPRYCH